MKEPRAMGLPRRCAKCNIRFQPFGRQTFMCDKCGYANKLRKRK